MKKWTSEFLATKFGSKMVRVAFAPYGEYEGCEKAENFDDFKEFTFPDAVKSQLQFPDLVVVRPAFREILSPPSWRYCSLQIIVTSLHI